MNRSYLAALVSIILLPGIAIGQSKLSKIISSEKQILKTKGGGALSQKSFEQLLHSKELQSLSSAQQTLLLTRKFVEETGRLPRTRISAGNAAIPNAQCTPLQKIEMTLGNKFRHIIENKQIPREIRQEALKLRQDYSSKYQTMRVLEELNTWIVVHNSWPRKKIEHEGPLTQEEEKEIRLAQTVYFILGGSRPINIPKELLDQIRLVHAAYDPSYSPRIAAEASNPSQPKRYDIWPPLVVDAPVPSRPYDFYYNSSLPRDPATGRQQVLPFMSWKTSEQDSQLSSLMPPLALQYTVPQNQLDPLSEGIQKLFEQLDRWLNDFKIWPQIIEDVAKAPLQAQQGHYLALQLKWFRELPQINRQLRLKYNKWYFSENERELATQNSPTELFEHLRDWVTTHRIWPHTRVTPGVMPESYTSQDIERIHLARRVEAFVKYAHPTEQGRWRDIPPSSWGEVLRSTFPYDNPDLEQFRQLYQQRRKKNRKTYKE